MCVCVGGRDGKGREGGFVCSVSAGLERNTAGVSFFCTERFMAVPEHNFIGKCRDLEEENEFQLLSALQTLCQTLESSQLADQKLQLRQDGLGVIFFTLRRAVLFLCFVFWGHVGLAKTFCSAGSI